MKSDSQKVGDKVTGRDGDVSISSSLSFLAALEYWLPFPFYFLCTKDSMLNKAKNAVGMGSNNNQSGGNNWVNRIQPVSTVTVVCRVPEPFVNSL